MVDLSGSGVGESMAGTVDAITGFDDATDVGDVVLNTATAAIDGLGFLANPVDALATSVIGWLVEHLEPLRWPLDVTLGDPEAVQRTVTRWNDSALALDGASKDYGKAPETAAPTYLRGGSRSAAALAEVVPFRAEQISGAATACALVAQQTARAATAVAATRGLIRDTIVALVWDLLKKAVSRLAFAPFTFGGAAAAFVCETMFLVANELKRIGGYLADLLENLKVLVSNLGKVTARLDRYFSVAREVDTFRRFMPNVTAAPKVVLDVTREYLKADDTALATSDETDTAEVRAHHEDLDEAAIEERNADAPPPTEVETKDWWTRKGTLY
jgi:hypothetical protein